VEPRARLQHSNSATPQGGFNHASPCQPINHQNETWNSVRLCIDAQISVCGHSQVLIVVTNRGILRLMQLRFMLSNKSCVDLDFGRLRELTHKLQIGLIGQAASEPEERLLKIVIAPSAQIIILKVPLAVELDLLRFHLAVLHVNLVSNQDDRDVLANTDDVSVPIGNILVRDPGSHVKHDDGALPLNVVAIPKTTELLLTSRVPDIEGEWPTIGGKLQRVNLNAERWNVLLLEFACQVPLHQSSLTNTTITHKSEFKKASH